jgi:DNA-binding transcriptional ArsR family regulator
MSNSTTHAIKQDIPRMPIDKAMSIVSSIPRWLILRELSMGEPLPVTEIARRVRSTSTAISKHCSILLDSGIVYRGYGGLYNIDPRFLVPGERSIDLGFVLLRLDQMG